MCFASISNSQTTHFQLHFHQNLTTQPKSKQNTKDLEMQEMETTTPTTQPNQGEEEFIDIEVTSFKNSPPQTTKEFEFKMSSFSPSSHPKESTTADELFYNGKLLPLHTPPRLKMVQSLLQNTISSFEDQRGRPLEPSRSFTAPTTTSNTPFESCNISPNESCRVSCELNPDEYFFNWSTEATSFFSGGQNNNTHLTKKPWSKKIRLIKKLRSLKSLFLRSACSDEPNSKPEEPWNVSKSAKECVTKYIKLVKKNPVGEMEKDSTFSTMKSMLDQEMDDQVSFTCHRKSFSGAIKRHCTSKCYNSSSSASTSGSSSTCSSSSSSFSLKNHSLKRSISADSEVENSIQGAIAHCKKSQLKQDDEIRPCLVSSASRVAACGGVNGRPEISRI